MPVVTWTTKDGRKIPIRKLTDTHLVNIIRMLERNHEHNIEAAWSAAFSFNGEMAQMVAENAAEDLAWHGPEASYPIYDHLYTEAIRRNLEL